MYKFAELIKPDKPLTENSSLSEAMQNSKAKIKNVEENKEGREDLSIR